MLSKLFYLFMFLRLGSAVGQCGGSKAKLTVTILYDSNPGQNTVMLTDTTTGVNTTIALAQIANDLVTTDECVDVDTLYKITIKDSGGDGIASPNFASFSINDRLIASLSDFGSEAVYYFSASAQTCTGTRWILDIKYDGSPDSTAATLTGSTGGLVFSLLGLNLSFLAGQFIQIDRCLPVDTYSFSLTKAGGFSSPGFYRVFLDSTRVAVGSGGSVSTSFDVAVTTPAPSVAPAPQVCDDAFPEKYKAPDGADHNCIYLAERTQLIPTHCNASLPEPNALTLCPETCGVCADSCVDDEGAKFDLLGVEKRTCKFMRVRLSTNYDLWFPLFCVFNSTAYNSCPETCGKCDMIITGAETTDDTEDDSAREDPCVDSSTAKIWINGDMGVTGEKSCAWLETNSELQDEYCAKNHASNAYNVCAGTCGKCDE